MIGIVITMLMHLYIKVDVYIQGFPKETHVSQKLKILVIHSVIRKAKYQLLIFKQSGVYAGESLQPPSSLTPFLTSLPFRSVTQAAWIAI